MVGLRQGTVLIVRIKSTVHVFWPKHILYRRQANRHLEYCNVDIVTGNCSFHLRSMDCNNILAKHDMLATINKQYGLFDKSINEIRQ